MNPGVEKYFDGTVDINNGISYAHWASRINISTMGNDDEKGRTLFALSWNFVYPYVNNREEVLVYGRVDLISWLGGAIGVFGGYSIYDKESTETYLLELTPYKGLCIVVCLLNGQ